jgi:hypothetical protein
MQLSFVKYLMAISLMSKVILTAAAMGGNNSASEKQLEGEAIILFQYVMTSENTSAICEIETAWYEIDFREEYLKRLLEKHLGRDSRLETTQSRAPMDILDPRGLRREKFCGKEQRVAHERMQFEKFKSKLLSKKVTGRVSDNEILEMPRLAYAFPIFNNDYTKAAIVSYGEKTIFYQNGEGLLFDHQSGSIVNFYLKYQGEWALEDTEQLSIE